MKKFFSLTIYIYLLMHVVSLVKAEPLANQNLSGLYAKSLEHILRLDEKDIDLATAVLIISEQWNENIYGRKYIAKLDDMALDIQRSLDAKNIPFNHKAIPEINRYLFDDLEFTSVDKADNPDDLFLHTVIDNKRGYCLSLSVLYLALAERLGLPLYGVVVPGHFFVRYDDGEVQFNIETTSKGNFADDKHYIAKFKVPTENHNSIYMANLNKLQTLACFFNNLGNSYTKIGNIESAQLALERAVQINPSLAEARINLGNIYLQKDKTNDAVYEYRQALKINPADAVSHNNLGNAYFKKEWFNDAISEYETAIYLDPNFADAYTNLASTHCKKQMFNQAVFYLEEAINLEPENFAVFNRCGDVYYQMNNYHQAIRHYKKALDISPDSADAYYGLGLCYDKTGKTEDQIQAYKKALSLEPDMVTARERLGNTYFKQQNYDSAIEQYQKIIQIKPDSGTAYYNLGAAYANKGDLYQAQAVYLKAIEFNPEMADAHKGLAFVFYRLKMYQKAWRHIKSAQSLGADIPTELFDAVKEKL